MKKLTALILTIFLSINFLFAQSPVISSLSRDIEIQNISNTKYFDSTLNAINSAKSSIYLTMYFISLSNTDGNSKVLQLVNSLVEAQKRGVKVKVILDRTIDFTDNQKQDTKNQFAYEYLKNNNIEVYYDELASYTHAKCLVIDEETVIFGSTNWTTTALTKNNEISALIVSKPFAESLISEFNNIKLDLSENKKDETPSVEFNINLMPTFQKFIKNHDETLFAIYLYLIQKANFEFNQPKEFDYTEIKELFLKENTIKDSRKNFYIRRYFKRLQDTYNLIEYKNPTETTGTLKLILLNKARSLSVDEAFSIPQTFWLYNWNTRLTPQTIFFYFINAAEANETNKTWSKSIENIQKEYSVERKLVSKNMDILRYWNLIQIQYSRIQNGNYATRTPNIYTLLPIYSLEDFNNSINQLETKYSKAQVERALQYASIIYCDHDLYSIENIIQLELDHGEIAVKETFNLVTSYKSKADSKKSIRYVVGVLKKEKK